MITLDINTIDNRQLYGFLTSAIVPRPIAFVSTIDAAGKVNLSPFSYFTCVSTRPPVLMIAPVRKSRDGGQKDTFFNLKEVPECVISLVTYDMVEQMSLTSAPFPKGINEFEKSGLTEAASTHVQPPRVKESPVSFECKVTQIIELGENGGAGNVVLCEILTIHVNEQVLDENGKIDAYKIDAVARLGGSLYSRLIPESIFEIKKPETDIGIGVDALPKNIQTHTTLTGNEKGKLGSISAIPDVAELEQYPSLKILLERSETLSDRMDIMKALLSENRVKEAWLVALASGEMG